MLSQVGAQGLSNPGTGSGGFSPAGAFIAPPSGGGQESYWQWVGNQDLSNLEGNFYISSGNSEGGAEYTPVGPIIQGIESLISFFEWLFGGGSSPPIPRQLMHRRHPLYAAILGILESLIPTEASPVSAIFAGLGAAPSNVPPLQRADYSGQVILVGSQKSGPRNPESAYADCLQKHLYTGGNSPLLRICFGGSVACLATLGEPVPCVFGIPACLGTIGVKPCCAQIANGGNSACLDNLEPPIPGP